YAVSVVPLSTPIDTLVTKEWKVPPGFLSQAPSTGGGTDPLAAPAGAGGAAAADATKGGSGIARRLEARDYLTAAGITFPPGSSPAGLTSDFPFTNPNGNPVGTQPVTSGLRNGNLAISQNAIDALLFGVAGTSAIAPAVGALSGVFTDPQFQLVVRALNQRKG